MAFLVFPKMMQNFYDLADFLQCTLCHGKSDNFMNIVLRTSFKPMQLRHKMQKTTVPNDITTVSLKNVEIVIYFSFLQLAQNL